MNPNRNTLCTNSYEKIDQQTELRVKTSNYFYMVNNFDSIHIDKP